MNVTAGQTEKKERLLSLDTLRGFDMFWITGGRDLVLFLANITGAGWLTQQMDHAKWEGFYMYDLIFPLFMFISGVAIPYAILTKINKGIPKKNLVNKALRRMVILIILGFIYNGVFEKSISLGRYPSVLGQIGIAYFFSALIFIYSEKLCTRVFWLLGIMISITIIQLFIPVPGFGAGVLTPEGCINGYIDRIVMPGVLYYKIFDNEGLICIISATSITLLGGLTGLFIKEKNFSEYKKIWIMILTGMVLIIIAELVSPVYPIIKRCWTSSYVLLAGGISIVLMALFYLLIDVLKWQKWTFFFRIIGMNSIFVYLFVRFINVKYIATSITGWSESFLSAEAFQLCSDSVAIGIIWFVLYYMFKKNIFLRV